MPRFNAPPSSEDAPLLAPIEGESEAVDREARNETLATETRPASRLMVSVTQLSLVIVFFLCWQFLPDIDALSTRWHIFDRFFISSPRRVAVEIVDLAQGTDNAVFIGPYLWRTMQAMVLGTLIGCALGALCGLFLSNSDHWSRVLQPFINAINAVPRVAMIPLIMLIFGTTLTSSIVISITVVFFVVFFNAYEGGRTVSNEVLQNIRLLGATRWQVMRRARLPFVLAWTLASLPLAIAFSFLGVVTGEVLTGYPGVGRLISLASNSADSTLTLAVVVYLSVFGVLSVGLANLIKRRVLHWWSA